MSKSAKKTYWIILLKTQKMIWRTHHQEENKQCKTMDKAQSLKLTSKTLMGMRINRIAERMMRKATRLKIMIRTSSNWHKLKRCMSLLKWMKILFLREAEIGLKHFLKAL